ncbi:hypothetical protein BJ508DRAFT_378335 [Ascobolus immersus RN42]|uniref:Uncharacterized protein n=1 Tax=Ascobolus immersus RN42 TaxID=1160509 RepID=A0A3N4I314_ASCIM|nr:hypothetical protein BJ508DRAFT_378335 [Ascobolus immersus RN42]
MLSIINFQRKRRLSDDDTLAYYKRKAITAPTIFELSVPNGQARALETALSNHNQIKRSAINKSSNLNFNFNTVLTSTKASKKREPKPGPFTTNIPFSFLGNLDGPQATSRTESGAAANILPVRPITQPKGIQTHRQPFRQIPRRTPPESSLPTPPQSPLQTPTPSRKRKMKDTDGALPESEYQLLNRARLFLYRTPAEHQEMKVEDPEMDSDGMRKEEEPIMPDAAELKGRVSSVDNEPSKEEETVMLDTGSRLWEEKARHIMAWIDEVPNDPVGGRMEEGSRKPSTQAGCNCCLGRLRVMESQLGTPLYGIQDEEDSMGSNEAQSSYDEEEDDRDQDSRFGEVEHREYASELGVGGYQQQPTAVEEKSFIFLHSQSSSLFHPQTIYIPHTTKPTMQHPNTKQALTKKRRLPDVPYRPRRNAISVPQGFNLFEYFVSDDQLEDLESQMAASQLVKPSALHKTPNLAFSPPPARTMFTFTGASRGPEPAPTTPIETLFGSIQISGHVDGPNTANTPKETPHFFPRRNILCPQTTLFKLFPTHADFDAASSLSPLPSTSICSLTSYPQTPSPKPDYKTGASTTGRKLPRSFVARIKEAAPETSPDGNEMDLDDHSVSPKTSVTLADTEQAEIMALPEFLRTEDGRRRYPVDWGKRQKTLGKRKSRYRLVGGEEDDVMEFGEMKDTGGGGNVGDSEGEDLEVMLNRALEEMNLEEGF